MKKLIVSLVGLGWIMTFLMLLIIAGVARADILLESQQRYVDAQAVAGPNNDHRNYSAPGFGSFDATADVSAIGLRGAWSGAYCYQESDIQPGYISAFGKYQLWAVRSGQPEQYVGAEPAMASFSTLFDVVFSVTDVPHECTLQIVSNFGNVGLRNKTTGQSIVVLESGHFGPTTIILNPGQYALGAGYMDRSDAPPDSFGTGEAQYYGIELKFVPEPGSITLLFAGAISLLTYAWRRRNWAA